MSVAEVLVAGAVLLAGVVAGGRATAAAVAAEGRAAARGRAAAAAYGVVDVLAGQRCLAPTGAEVADDLDALDARCRAALALTGPLGVGEGSTGEGAAVHRFSYSSRWVGADAPGPGEGCSDPAYASRPLGVDRTVRVRYRERGEALRTLEVAGFEAIALDGHQQRSWQRSNLVVAAGDPEAVAELRNATGGSVARSADARGCVWFPLLRTGRYEVRLTRRSGAADPLVVDHVADPRAPSPRVVTP